MCNSSKILPLYVLSSLSTPWKKISHCSLNLSKKIQNFILSIATHIFEYYVQARDWVHAKLGNRVQVRESSTRNKVDKGKNQVTTEVNVDTIEKRTLRHPSVRNSDPSSVFSSSRSSYSSSASSSSGSSYPSSASSSSGSSYPSSASSSSGSSYPSSASSSKRTPLPAIDRERILNLNTEKSILEFLEKFKNEGYSSRLLALEFAKNGALGQLLWMVEKNWITPDELRTISYQEDEILSEVNQAWLELQVAFTSPSSMSLDQLALNDHGLGLGYKSANLIRLQSLAEQASKACVGCEVRVPAFFPFGDTQMRAFLRQSYPDLDQDWQAFIDSFSISDREAFLESNGHLALTKEACARLGDIRKKIIAGFKLPYVFMTPQLETWLDKENPTFLIIRSTGKEDSTTHSNAGGNASIPFIAPNTEAISEAIGQVLASYFSEKSILQRLSARDTTLLTEAPFLPVLIQDMVAENIGGIGTPSEQVPRSGVMFTRAQGKAEGLTELYVGLGNNEGVVSSQVATDRYQMSKHFGLARAVHNKDTRFVAIQKGDHYSCEPIKNEDLLLVHSPALPHGVAIDMKHVADYFSQAYADLGTPASLDIEFSIQMGLHNTRPTIYLLQARPLVEARPSHAPSYIDSKYLKNAEKIEAHTLVDAGAYVRVVQNPSQVIVTDTITQALEVYLNPQIHAVDSTQIKTVLIRQAAPGTSHEAVTFQARGVGILIVEDATSFQNVKAMINQALVKPVCLDMQRGLVLHLPVDEEAICQGYTCYPMALEYSMRVSPIVWRMREAILEANEQKQDVKMDDETGKSYDLFMKRLHALTLSATGKKREHTLRELLEIMSQGSAKDAKVAAAQAVNTLRNILFNKQIKGPALSHLELMMIIENVMDVIEYQFLPSVDEPAKSLERLYPVRLLEACLFQEEGKVRGGFSLASYLKAIRNQHQALTEAHELFNETADVEKILSQAPLLLLNKTLLKNELSAQWKCVLQHLEAIDQTNIQLVCEHIRNVNDLGTLTEWSNVNLPKVFDKLNLSPTQLITPELANAVFVELIALAKESIETIEQLKEMKAQVQLVQQSMQRWADPAHVEKQASSLMEKFHSMGFHVTNSNKGKNKKISGLFASYEQCPESLRLVYLHILLETVRTFDEVIKTCKGSIQYRSSQQKAFDSHLLLTHYKKMMEAISCLADQQGALKDREENFLPDFLSKLDSHFQGIIFPKETSSDLSSIALFETEYEKLLLPTASFHVGVFNLANRQDFTYGVTWPTTLEDCFTTFHQLSESAINLLKIKAGFSEKIFDERLSYIVQYLRETVIIPSRFWSNLDSRNESDMNLLMQGKLSKISTEGSFIEIVLDIPMRQHASQMKIIYDRLNPSKVTLHMNIFGENEGERWAQTASTAALIGSDIPELTMNNIEWDFSSSSIQKIHLEFVIDGDKALISTATILAKIFELTSEDTTPVSCGKYIEAVNDLRKSLQYKPLDPTTANLERGTFFLMPWMIDEAIDKGEGTLAKLLIDKLECFLEANPSLKQKKCYGGFIRFPNNKIPLSLNPPQKRLESAFKMLKEKYATQFSLS